MKTVDIASTVHFCVPYDSDNERHGFTKCHCTVLSVRCEMDVYMYVIWLGIGRAGRLL
jgi:hypothetical protein